MTTRVRMSMSSLIKLCSKGFLRRLASCANCKLLVVHVIERLHQNLACVVLSGDEKSNARKKKDPVTFCAGVGGTSGGWWRRMSDGRGRLQFVGEDMKKRCVIFSARALKGGARASKKRSRTDAGPLGEHARG